MLASIAYSGPALHQHWANVSGYLGNGLSGDGGMKVSPAVLPQSIQQLHLGKVRKSCVVVGPSSETLAHYNHEALGRCWSRCLTGIDPAKGCDAGPTLNRYWVGRPT